MKLYSVELSAWAICDPDDTAAVGGFPSHYAEWYEQAMSEAITAAALDVWERVRREHPELRTLGFYLTDGGDFVAGMNPDDGKEYGATVDSERVQAVLAGGSTPSDSDQGSF